MKLPSKSLALSAAALIAAVAVLRGQNAPPAPIPSGAQNPGTNQPPSGGGSGDPAPMDPTQPGQLKQYSLDHYQKLIDKSPFSYEIEKPEAAPTISPFVDYALGGFTIDEGRGVTSATLINRKTQAVTTAYSDKPNDDGLQLVALNRGTGISSSTVRLRKGSEEGEVAYDEKVSSGRKQIVAQAQPMRGNQPGALNLNRANGVQSAVNNQLNLGNGGVPQPPLPPGVTQQQVQQGQPQQAQQVQVNPATNQPRFQQQGQQPGQQPGQQGGGREGGRRRVILPPPQQ